MTQRNNQVRFRLLQKKVVKTADGESEEVTYSSFRVPAIYFTRDEHGRAIRKVIHQYTTTDSMGKEIPVGEDQEFISGTLLLYKGKDDHIINALRESVNNKNFKYRNQRDEAVFEEVDEVQERLGGVDLMDKIVEAYKLIDASAYESVVEYANSLGIYTGDLEAKLAVGKTKGPKLTNEYGMIVKELKNLAQHDPTAFIDKFNDPLRPILANIKQGIEQNVLTFNPTLNEYAWVMGSSKHNIVQVPKGVADTEKWFAAWLKGNEATYLELVSRVEISSKV